MKKLIAFFLSVTCVLGLFTACGNSSTGENGAEDGLKVAVLEGTCGADVWEQVCNAFETQTGIKVNLTVGKNLEELISANPDVVHSGNSSGVTEQLIKDKKLYELNNVLAATIPGESVTVADKIENGFLDSAVTMPYGDGKTYLAPMFCSPWGLYFNSRLFEMNRWDVPTTWDEMWVLAETALAKGIYLFTYPNVEHMETFLCALMYAIGGADFYNSVANNEEGIWDSKEARNLVKVLDKLAKYTHPATVAQANDQDYKKNQLLLIEKQVLFMPNNNNVTTEMLMEVQSISDGTFNWGVIALPAVTEEGSAYSYSAVEQIWIPADAEKKADAEQFIAFLYSNKAAEIFAVKGAVQPIKGISAIINSSAQWQYALFDNGAKAALSTAIGNNVLVDTFNKLVDGTIKSSEFLANVKAVGVQ